MGKKKLLNPENHLEVFNHHCAGVRLAMGIGEGGTALAPGLRFVNDPDGNLLGFVAIDRIVAGRSCGGIRAGPRVTADEIGRIARVMTLKCGFAGLAAGGAKGGVIVPEGSSAEQRASRLEAFGRAAAALLRSGVWSHGADMGTTDLDIARIRRAAGIGADPGLPGPLRVPATGDASSGSAAGLTVALSTEAALDSLGVSLRGARIAIQGAGAVGRAAMESLAAAGARIVAISTVAGTLGDDGGLDVRSVLENLRQSGDKFTSGGAPPEAVLAASCDVMLLCAGSDTLDATAAERLDVRAVVCGANIPFTDEVADRLVERGILVLPDFVAGTGGVLGSTLVAVAGATAPELELVLRRHFKPLVAQTLASAAARGTTVAAEARRRALRVIAACDAAYGSERPDALLPERLAPRDSGAVRLLLAAERRCRGSTRLAALARLLHGSAVARAERVLSASYAAGAGS
jgi:glutamate dehydrogenase (NAD(P)+)